MSALLALYRAAGEPEYPRPHAGICRTCGERGRGVAFSGWVKNTFTDWDKITPGDILCDACQFAFDEQQQLLTARTAKDKPQRMRNYSHFVVGGRWLPLSKGHKHTMRDLLLRAAPTVVVIANSGQKHIIFRGRVGWWQFEECSLLPDPAALGRLIKTATPMLAVFAKTELESGQYFASRIGKFGIEAWRASEAILKPHRGSVLFSLAIFLSQKEEGTYDASGNSAQPAVSVLAGHRHGVQAAIFDDNMEPVRAGNQGIGVHGQTCGFH